MQSIYQTGGGLGLTVQIGRTQIGNASATGLETSGRGFEIFADAKLLDQLPRMIDEADADAVVPVRPLEVGQYDVVCDAATVANLLDETFGRATELDRALGYEANAGGTSYLGPDPMTWLGQPVASPLMTITADRTHPTGVATVKWDDDGVAAEEFPLVQGGQLVDYQTTREHAPHLSAWYGTRHQVVRSHGCAASQDAQSVTLSMIPNLTIAPNASGPAFLDMVAGLPKGVAIAGAYANADFQAKNGMLWRGTFYDVKNGKRVAKLTNNAGVLFSTLELWKHVTALGGPASAASMAMSEYKGEPGQTTTHTINSVAVAFKQQAVVDLRRKA
jgi:TldD protein